MNINPLANQRRSYRLFVLLLIISAAILAGWIVAQFFLPKETSLSSQLISYELNFVEDMESELMECDLLFSLDLPKENRAIRQRQIDIMAQKLTAFERRLQRVAQSGNLDPYTYQEFQQRSQRMHVQLGVLFQDHASLYQRSNPRVRADYPTLLHDKGRSSYQYRQDRFRKSWERNQSCFKEYYLPRP